MSNPTKSKHANPSGIGIIPDHHYFPGFQGQPTSESATQLIQTAEDLLARREPKPGPYWPSNPRRGDNDTLRPIRWDSFEYSQISARGDQIAGFAPDDEIEAMSPGFKKLALLDAIREVLRFAELFLRDEVKGSAFEFINVYLHDDIRAACRKHLVQLLARWYELESGTPGVSPSNADVTDTTQAATLARTAESLLNGEEPPQEEEQAFREWIAEEADPEPSDVESGRLESVIRSTLEGMRLAASPTALGHYRRHLVGLLNQWQQVALTGGVV